MRKIIYIILSITFLVMTSCNTKHYTPDNPITPEKKEEPEMSPKGNSDKPNESETDPPNGDENNKPNGGESDKPDESDSNKPKEDEGKTNRPSDFDIARRIYAQWNNPENIYELITLNLDPLFIKGMDASFSTKSLSKYVNFLTTDVSGTTIYTLTGEDLEQLKLSDFKYDNGTITFRAKFGTQSVEKKLSLNFSREKYLLARIKPKEKINLYMQGVHEYPGLFMAELFDYDQNRYDLIPKNCSKVGTSLSMTISVLPHNLDGEMATLVYSLDGFKSMDALSNELTIAPISGFAEKFNRYYRISKGNLDNLNRYAEKWSEYLQFSVKYGDEYIDLVWGYTNAENKQRVLEPDSSQKRHKDLYLIDPKFIVEEVKELNDILDIKIRLAYANETEIKDAIYTLKVTAPKK